MLTLVGRLAWCSVAAHCCLYSKKEQGDTVISLVAHSKLGSPKLPKCWKTPLINPKQNVSTKGYGLDHLHRRLPDLQVWKLQHTFSNLNHKLLKTATWERERLPPKTSWYWPFPSCHLSHWSVYSPVTNTSHQMYTLSRYWYWLLRFSLLEFSNPTCERDCESLMSLAVSCMELL
jgi:hypothetical protein